MNAKTRTVAKTVIAKTVAEDAVIDKSLLTNTVESNIAFMNEYFELFAVDQKCAVSLHKFNVRVHKDFSVTSLFNHANKDTKSYMLDKSLESAKTLEDHAIACKVSVSYIKRHIKYLLTHRNLTCKLVAEKSNDKTLVKFVLC